jgi:23S rRNA maturation mini-RNase III
VLHRVQAECSESREAEFSAASTQFVAASQAAADKLMQEWMANAKQKPTRRGRPSKVTASEMAT